MESSIKELSKYRYDCAEEALEDAKIMFENNRYKNALNRAYYAIFYALRAVNALSGFDSSKHSGVIAHFNQTCVKTGTFDKEVSKIIKLASEKREQPDYLDFFIASKEDADQQIQRADNLLQIIKSYLVEKRVL